MAVKLSSPAIRDILSDKDIKDPLLQVLKIKEVQGNSTFRLILSDGDYMTNHALFSTQLSEFAKTIDENAVIKLHHYIISDSNGKKIIIIVEASLVLQGKDLSGKIGDPILIGPSGQVKQSNDKPEGASVAGTSTSPLKKPGIFAISTLTPYSNMWTICARVTNKSDMKKWSKPHSEGVVFNVNLLDESGEIRATGFNEDCNRLFPCFEENKSYYIAGGRIKSANKKFSPMKNDYEITFTSGTMVTPCLDDSAIPALNYDLVSLSYLNNLENDETVDVVGVCVSCNDVLTVLQRNSGREITKRDIQIIDDSNTEVRVTLWGSQAEKFDGSSKPILGIKGAKVSDFNGRSLSILSSSTVQINPDIKAVHKLRQWYSTIGATINTTNISRTNYNNADFGSGAGSNLKTLEEVDLENLGISGAEYFSAKACVNYIKEENCMYQACPADTCNKKVIDLTNGIYRCEKCDRGYDTFQWRLILRACICDSTDTKWVTFFHDQAETLLGCSAQNLAQLKETREDSYRNAFKKAKYIDYNFKLKINMDNFNDEHRLKLTVRNLTPIDPLEHAKYLLKDIEKMLN